MRSQEVRDAVQQFYTRHAPGGRSAEDAFPAWWLHREFELAPNEAIACSSTGSHDHGLDGFFIEARPDREPVLHLIQAKFSPTHRIVRDGIRDLRRTLVRLDSLRRRDTPGSDIENTIWVRLRARLEGRAFDNLVLHCRVLHIAEGDENALLAEAKAERAEFEETAATLFPDHKVRLSLSGPRSFAWNHIAVTPGASRQIYFEGVEASSLGERLFIGLGKLADLVQLYEEYGDNIFSKNVRLFNYRAAERGPARHLRETLRQCCAQPASRRTDPMRFTLFHNGITLHVTSAERRDGGLTIRSPGILNGCQTVKSAWIFKHEKLFRDRIDADAWNSLRVPIRVIRTTDEELVREITVSNNRQNAIRPSGFRANDPVQLRLGDRLKQRGIFYERQESAFENLKRSSPKTLEDDYPHSFDAPLRMEELAQALALMSEHTALSVASKVADLFETPVYERLFADENLEHLDLLVFATNVLRNVHLALKDTKEKSARLDPMVPARFRYLATRALVRWIVKHDSELVAAFGAEVMVRAGPRHPFRERLRKLISPQNTGLQTLLPELWHAAGDPWPSATDKELADKLLKKLGVQEFEPLVRYRGRA
ncbi:AIPR family protein [Sorangium sp. So ce1182]|uniref:AIPR family protein n=1 Tax=Sorangium sp. So ce1182 TaxID=3133334 RepID=UPI003F637475